MAIQRRQKDSNIAVSRIEDKNGRDSHREHESLEKSELDYGGDQRSVETTEIDRLHSSEGSSSWLESHITVQDLRMVFELMFELSLKYPLTPDTVVSILGKKFLIYKLIQKF